MLSIKVALYPLHRIENYWFRKNSVMIALLVTACRFSYTLQAEMNCRLISNTSKSAVIPFGFFWTNGCARELYWQNLHWILKNLSVHGAAVKFKPVSLFKCRKAYLFIVRKYGTWEVGFKLRMSVKASLYSYCWPFSGANSLWIGLNKTIFKWQL